jgi:hypothetical protein
MSVIRNILCSNAASPCSVLFVYDVFDVDDRAATTELNTLRARWGMFASRRRKQGSLASPKVSVNSCPSGARVFVDSAVYTQIPPTRRVMRTVLRLKESGDFGDRALVHLCRNTVTMGVQPKQSSVARFC